MRTRHLAAALASAVLAALAIPVEASAWVVVRAPVYVHPVAVVVVAPALTEKLPVNSTMWTLPSGCTAVSSSGANYFVCGPNWLKAIPSDKGTYYAVVAPP